MRNTLEALKTICNATQGSSDWGAYRAYRSAYRGCIKEAKRSAYNDYISTSDNKQRSCWALINRERSGGAFGRSTETHISPNKFGVYFAEIAEKIVHTLPNAVHTDYITDKLAVNSSTIFLRPVTPSELISAISSLKNKSSLDYYGMNAKLLKYICDQIAIPLTSIYNMCIAEGVFPYSLKVNKITPVFKKGSKIDMGNYRPIAISPILAKLFEVILKERLLNFFCTTKVFTPQQFGFRAGVSTVHAVLKLLESAVEGFDDGCRTEVTLCDLTKAFDCVSPTILLRKLHACGVRGVCHKLLNSYLTDRRQYVVVDGGESEILPQVLGVPQGSVIGPILFLVYINDLPNCVTSASTLLFADDTTLYCSHRSVDVARARMGEAIEQASSWFESNRLVINHLKTQTLTLSTDRNVPKQPPVVLLGLVIDQRLTWASHVDRVCSKVSSGMFALRNLVPLVSLSVVKMAYFALVHSHLTYGVLLWGGSAESQRAFVAQKKALRVMVRAGSRDHCREWFRYLGILTLPSLYIYMTCLHVHTVAGSLRTRADVHGYDTRGHDLYLIPSSRTRTSEKNKVNIVLYNALPDHFKSLTISRFKYRLKQFLIDRAFYSLDEYLSRWE